MPKAKQPEATEAAPVTALSSVDGRAWLAGELEKAEREEKLGPGGAGWTYNESHRAAIVERAEFLRALVALVTEN